MLAEYEALVAKVDAFTRAASEHADMACRRGCSSCCEVSLTLNQVEAAALRRALEALDPDAQARIAARAGVAAERSRCVLLEADGGCAVYSARPLVCRTQGFALRYPPGFIPADAVRARSSAGEVTHCPLNFTARAPAPAQVLDAERVDQILALVNLRFAKAEGLDPEARHPIPALAAALGTNDPSHR